ncbi:MAG: hypothetical protein K1X64_12820 [Myxococcaceae bacterium]|nr:hypothetical protein [Myxococcaceae bacterium]
MQGQTCNTTNHQCQGACPGFCLSGYDCCCTATGTPVMQADQKNCGSYGELCQDCTATLSSCQYTFGGFGGGVAALGGGPGGGIVASGTFVCQ